MYHYTYKLTHIETGEFYYGVRSCKCMPEEDKYKGSMVTWKTDKGKLDKKIIDVYENRLTANRSETFLILKHFNHPLNRNYSIPHTRFLPAKSNKITKLWQRLKMKRLNSET